MVSSLQPLSDQSGSLGRCPLPEDRWSKAAISESSSCVFSLEHELRNLRSSMVPVLLHKDHEVSMRFCNTPVSQTEKTARHPFSWVPFPSHTTHNNRVGGFKCRANPDKPVL